MTKTTSRRAILAGAAAVLPASVAAALPVEGDQELRRLWAEYLQHTAKHEAVTVAYRTARITFEREAPPCPPDDVMPGHHWDAQKPLREKHGLEPLFSAWNETDDRVRETIQRIHEVEATTLFGIGVKLAAVIAAPEEEDISDAVRSALADIDAVLGTRAFAIAFGTALDKPMCIDGEEGVQS